MIKQYRNALLAAAVAALMTGCGGGSQDGDGPNPINDPNLIPQFTAEDELTHQAIAQLLGGAFYELINTTTTLFSSLNSVTSEQSTMGKVLAPVVEEEEDAAGVFAKLGPINCARGGTFSTELELGIERTVDNGDDSKQPDLSKGLQDFANGIVETAIDMTFTDCNEPKHVGYNADGSPRFETMVDVDGNDVTDTNGDPLIQDNIMDGKFGVSLRSNPYGNDNLKDFALNGTVKMVDYFIQRDMASAPEVLNGSIDISLLTLDSLVYDMTLSTSLSNNNKETNGFVTTSLLAEGQVEINESLGFEGYSLDVSGKLRNYEIIDSSFQLYTSEPLSRAGDSTDDRTLFGILGVPSQGIIELVTHDKFGNVQVSTATVLDDGSGIEIVSPSGNSTCTWDEVSKNEC